VELALARRFSRQIALPDLGSEGQERLLAAEVALAGGDLGLETAARYLAGAGISRFRILGDSEAVARAAEEGGARVQRLAWPGDGAGWLAALDGCTLALRSGLDDDALLRAAVRLGIPLLVTRAGPEGVDLLSFRRQGPCPHASLDVPVRPASPGSDDPAAAVVAGTLAAAEAAWRIARPDEPPRARHLRLPAAGAPLTQELPWTPECFLCGGSGREAVTT
jgi:hypothetical protein